MNRPDLLIICYDFRRTVGIVPDFRHNVQYVTILSVLTPVEYLRLDAVVNRNISLMGKEFGRTT